MSGLCHASIAGVSSLALGVAAFAGSVFQREQLDPFWQAARDGRADVVLIGDSNSLFKGQGWDAGWNVALHDSLGIYASPTLSLGEGNGFGTGHGEDCSTLFSAGMGFQYNSQLPNVGRFLQNMPFPAQSVFLPGNAVLTARPIVGMQVRSGGIFNLQEAARYWFSDASFTEPGGRFRLCARTLPTFTVIADSGFISTTSTLPQLRIRSLELPAFPQARSAMEFRTDDATRSPDSSRGPSLFFYQRYETTKPTGASVQTMAYMGGKSLSDMASQLNLASDDSLSLYLRHVRMLQTGPKHVLFRINSGLNDRNKAAARSVGPGQYFPGDSAAAYADNLTAIVKRLESVWVKSGWDLSEMYLLITPSHAIAGDGSSNDDAKIMSYRRAAEAWARGRPRTAVADLAAIMPASAMYAGRYYDDPASPFHLTRCGFLTVARRELRALQGQPIDPPTYVPAVAAATALELPCESSVNASTAWLNDDMGTTSGAGQGTLNYAGSSVTNPGNEIAYIMDHPGGYFRLGLQITPGDGDLNLYLLDASANPSAVIAFSESDGLGGEGLELDDLPPGRYTLVVDTRSAIANCGRGVNFQLFRTCERCKSDFDMSGGTPDAADVEAFFIAWLAGDDSADIDGSGSTPDSNDIDDFFIRWLRGC
jgi:hypothetical protein